MKCDIEFAESPEKSIAELYTRIENETAFIIGATGMSRKERRELERDALSKLKDKMTPLKYHLVRMGGITFEVVE